MRKPNARTRKTLALCTGPVAILVAGLLVWQGSNAAFSSSTRNSGNSWSAGSVTLTDDDNGVAGFTVTNLIPGGSGEKCIQVTAKTGTPGVVRGYVQNLNVADSKGLENRIKLDVEQGTGGDFGSCVGFTVDPDPEPKGFQTLATLASVNTDFATGGAPWNVKGSGNETRTYKGSWKFDTTGMSQSDVDKLQGATTSIDLVWELQNAGETP